jgi:hypothetical protein
MTQAPRSRRSNGSLCRRSQGSKAPAYDRLVTPKSVLREYLAQELLSDTSERTRKEVISELARNLDGILMPDDWESLASGQIRWETSMDWAAHEFRKSLHMHSKKPGIWQLTAKGKRELSQTLASNPISAS